MYIPETTSPVVGDEQFVSSNANMVQNILVGNRIPQDFFVTQGRGESDITIHAGSYHLALKDAGIERMNIMTYSSILPAIAREVARPLNLTHGAVMETIMAAGSCQAGERANAGIIWGWLTDRKSRQRYGGLVCEHYGDYSDESLEKLLADSLEELYVNGFDEEFELGDIRIESQCITPKKKFGTALVALCFTSYSVPVLERSY